MYRQYQENIEQNKSPRIVGTEAAIGALIQECVDVGVLYIGK